MKRWAHIGFSLAAVISLLLSIAATVSWIKSYKTLHLIERKSPRAYYRFGASSGKFFIIAHVDPNVPEVHQYQEWDVRWSSQPVSLLDSTDKLFPDAHPPVAGFFFGRNVAYGDNQTELTLPMPFVVAILAILPIAFIVRRRRRARRIAPGCCRSCGYDLRATHQPGGDLVARCPECGTRTSPVKDG